MLHQSVRKPPRKKALLLVTLFLIVACVIPPMLVPLGPNEKETGPDHHYVMVNGKQVHYVMQGTGEALVLLHAGGTSWHDWEAIIPKLAEKYTVIAPDFPGSGNSEELDGTHNLEAYTAFLKEFINVVGLSDQKINLMGMSFGSITALNYALDNQHSINKLILLETAHKYTHPERQPVLRVMAFLFQNSVIRDVSKWWIYQFGSRGWLLFIDLDTGRDYRRASSRATVEVLLSWSELNLSEEKIRNLNIPVLVVAAENDKEILLQTTKEFYGLLPNAQLVVIPGVSHYDFGLKNLGKDGLLDQSIFNFLESK